MSPVVGIADAVVRCAVWGCGYPGSPAHASVAFSSEAIESGTVATYTCDNGYELLGPPRRTCSENGTWVPQGIPFCGESCDASLCPHASDLRLKLLNSCEEE